MSFDTFVKAVELVVLLLLFSGLVGVAVGTMLDGVRQHYPQVGRYLRSTPDPPRVRKLPFFDQDVPS